VISFERHPGNRISLSDLHRILTEDPAYAGRFSAEDGTASANACGRRRPHRWILLDGRAIEDADVAAIKVDICARYGLRSINRNDLWRLIELVAVQSSR
jgi:hypothetical protein